MAVALNAVTMKMEEAVMVAAVRRYGLGGNGDSSDGGNRDGGSGELGGAKGGCRLGEQLPLLSAAQKMGSLLRCFRKSKRKETTGTRP